MTAGRCFDDDSLLAHAPAQRTGRTRLRNRARAALGSVPPDRLRIDARAPVMQMQVDARMQNDAPVPAPTPRRGCAHEACRNNQTGRHCGSASVGRPRPTARFTSRGSPRSATPRARASTSTCSPPLGVWQPDGRVMRVLLLESRPAAGNVGEMLGAIQSGETNGVANRSAVLELRFVPTAQAFDRNEPRQRHAHRQRRQDHELSGCAQQPRLARQPAVAGPEPAARSAPSISHSIPRTKRSLPAARSWKQSWRLTLTA